MAFLLQGVGVGVGFAIEDDISGLNLYRLTCALRGDECAVDTDAGTGGDASQQVLVEVGKVDNNLYVINRGAVVEGYEGNVFVATFGSNPSLDVDGGIDKRLGAVGK